MGGVDRVPVSDSGVVCVLITIWEGTRVWKSLQVPCVEVLVVSGFPSFQRGGFISHDGDLRALQPDWIDHYVYRKLTNVVSSMVNLAQNPSPYPWTHPERYL